MPEQASIDLSFLDKNDQSNIRPVRIAVVGGRWINEVLERLIPQFEFKIVIMESDAQPHDLFIFEMTEEYCKITSYKSVMQLLFRKKRFLIIGDESLTYIKLIREFLGNGEVYAYDNIRWNPSINIRVNEQLSKSFDLLLMRNLTEIVRQIEWDNEQQGLGIIIPFTFAPEVASACEQYLLYFGQFLKDIGIDAATNINHDAGQVLFSIIPANPDEALDRIREALNVYLHLPEIIPVNDYSIDQEIAVQRMAANLDHLRGQLRLANATIQAKDATLEASAMMIAMLKQSPTDIRLGAAQPERTSKSSDKEELFGGQDWHQHQLGRDL